MSQKEKKSLEAEPIHKERFAILNKRKERFWKKLQLCYDLIPQLPQKIDVFKVRAGQMATVQQDFNDILEEFEFLSTVHDDFVVDTVQLSTSFDELYFQILATFNELTTTSRTNLPEVEIRKFDGSYEKFSAFIALYDTLIHKTDLKNIEKFSYLLSYLEGSALRLVQTVVFAPENYETAYHLLTSRYRSPRQIANHYITEIFKLTPLKSNTPQGIQRLVETLQAHVTSLKALDIDDLADYILLEISLRLLDNRTRKTFETRHINDKKFPRFQQLVDFLREECTVSDLMIDNPSVTPKTKPTHPVESTERRKVYMAVQEAQPTHINSFCPLCKEVHKLIKCSSFLAASPRSRYEIVKKHKRCYACFGNHFLSQCKSKRSCQTCGNTRHNTLLHFGASPQWNEAHNSTHEEIGATQTPDITTASVSFANSSSLCRNSFAILGTAQAHVRSSTGEWIRCRLVIDSGSQVNFITNRLADCLKLPRSKCPYSLKGIGQSSLSTPQGLVTCKLSSLFSTEQILQFDAIVLSRITTDLPTVPLPSSLRNRFSTLKLADPHFDKTAPIDILLGVEAVLDITPSYSAHIKGQPSALLTSLGWIIIGSVELPTKKSLLQISSMHAQIDYHKTLDDNLRSFWELEEIPKIAHISPDDEMCENYFRKTITRNECGRYETRLPFKNGIRPVFGSNREQALNRFLKLEIRFKRDLEFHKLYADNLRDYIDQGQLVPASSPSPYILTHHGVKKETSSGTSVRVVFNPTEKDPCGISLNDTLLSGPKLQADIGQVITRFRIPPIALTCDIRQMFRAIALHPDDCKYQHIFWRFSPEEPVREWEHTRVIFGSTSSPYLAQRTIIQLLEDEGSNFPLAAAALQHGTYIDDILWGADDESTALELRNQLINLLQLGGFELGKWASSHQSIVEVGVNFTQKLPDSSSSLKVLGISWNPRKDIFHYVINPSNETPSKRGILSRIARTYDVNGYLSPFVFSLKILLQQLWLLKIDWDTALPPVILEKWNRILQELSLLENISIPRCIFTPSCLNSRLIGFSDASTHGMAAVIYLRVELSHTILVNLLIAKTRVAPLKTWTIPRLELGAAWVLSNLLRHIKPSFDSLRMDTPICFTDSTTTLAWINTPPYLLKTFVANRVAQIHENSPEAQWRHVPGSENPADPASRGLLPSELLECRLWWNGPNFLYKPLVDWPPEVDYQETPPEMKEISFLSNLLSIDIAPFDALFDRISSLAKLQRILAYTLRFVHNARARNLEKKSRVGPLTGQEYRDALCFAARLTQAQHLSKDITQLNKGYLCSKRYRNLSPFLDPRGLVMVGGRLKHAQLARNSRHPILIPYESRLATLLVDYFHLYSGHGGPQLIQSLIHRNYWIPSARKLIRKRIFRCFTCYRFKASPIQQPMADLPSFRVTPSRTFSHTGVDFAGPFLLKASALRTNRTVKCYLALFVCMATKAVHLEAVTSLTTDGCLAALDRFIARRGLPNHIYSDQGRNFRGAAREITEISQMLDDSNEEIANYLAARNIEWTFNPPYAANFGGIWEAGVKSFKHHFRRVVGKQVLTLEEFITVLTRIEGILNSRPLCPLSTSPDDGFDYLTPGHFLIGAPILSRPEHEVLDIGKSRLNRWQMTRHLIQSFWKRWSKEYLHSQLFRPKWVSNPPQTLSEGDLVFWFSPGMPPTQWPKGRISRLLSGADGIARVAKIRTPTGEVLRPINKIVPLPPN